MSYLEIYNETVNDLLRPSSMNLRIIAASIPIVSATSFEKERSFDFT